MVDFGADRPITVFFFVRQRLAGWLVVVVVVVVTVGGYWLGSAQHRPGTGPLQATTGYRLATGYRGPLYRAHCPVTLQLGQAIRVRASCHSVSNLSVRARPPFSKM